MQSRCRAVHVMIVTMMRMTVCVWMCLFSYNYFNIVVIYMVRGKLVSARPRTTYLCANYSSTECSFLCIVSLYKPLQISMLIFGEEEFFDIR